MRAKVVAAITASHLLFWASFVPAHAQVQLRSVKISQAFQHLLYIGLYVARDAGFFKEQGLEVTVSTAGGDAQAFAALTSGQVDFAQGDPAFVAIGAEKGWDGRVIVMAVDRAAMWGVSLKDIKPFTDPIGFKGLTVATYPQPNTSYVVQKDLVERAGLQLGVDTRIAQVQFGSEIAALRAGQVDIAQTIEPNVTQLEEQKGHVVFSYPEAFGPLAFTGLMASEKLIREQPDLVQHVVTAYEKAFQLIRTNPDKAVEIAAAQLPDLNKETIRRALQRLVSSGSIPAHTAINPESWNKLLKIRIAVGDLKAMPTQQLFDNSFANKALTLAK
jgi:NitT/TauT family transport system substrate-binding protein